MTYSSRYFALSSNLALMFAVAFVCVGKAWAHGGEDHGNAETPLPGVAAAAGDLLVTDGAGLFEIVLKYPAPEINQDASMRLFLSDFATNRAIEVAELDLTFRPSGVTLKSAPTQVSPGVYDLVVSFPRDTVYNLIVTVKATGRTDFIEVPNIYAGASAERFLAEHPADAGATPAHSTDGTPWWVITLVVVVVLGIGGFFLVRARRTKIALGVMLLVVVVPLNDPQVLAHGDEDHGAAATPTPSASTNAGGAELAVTKEQQFALEMLTELVARRSLRQTLSLTGTIVPKTDAIADVIAPTAGRVVGTSLPRLGEMVRKGQVLFRIAQVLSPAERTALSTERARARAELAAAEREVARLEKLEGVVAGKLLIEAGIRRDGAREVLGALSAQLSGQGGTVNVTAPISGEITMAEIASGEILDGSKVVYQIADLRNVWVQAKLFEKDVATVESSSYAEIQVPPYPDETFTGKFRTMVGAVDPESRALTALFEIANSQRKLKQNMSARVAVTTARRDGVLSVPASAVVESGVRRVVFLHTSAEGFAVRDVVLGSISGEGYVEVSSGVVSGDRVLVTGIHQMRAVAGL